MALEPPDGLLLSWLMAGQVLILFTFLAGAATNSNWAMLGFIPAIGCLAISIWKRERK